MFDAGKVNSRENLLHPTQSRSANPTSVSKGRAMGIIENELPHSIKLDDEAALKQIYKQYWSRLYVYAFNVLRDREICEDIVQELFIDLWERRHDVQISDLSSYLYQSVKYQIFNRLRESKHKRQLLMKLDLTSTRNEVEESYEKRELVAQIKNVISKIPQRRRIIFELSRNEGLSNKEISEHLGISLQTVKNQIWESLKLLRKSLSDLS